jgi:F-type H+-transporting ATPase subunit delta
VRNATIARNYAEALFELGARSREGEAYADAFRTLGEALSSDPRIERFLETPKIDAKAKESVLRQALEDRVPERFLRFVLVVVAKRRQSLLGQIQAAYQEILDEHAGRIHAQVTLARQADEATERLLAERLGEMLGKTVVPHVTVNPDILGGVVVRFGDRAMDGSIRRQLISLKRQMMHAGLPALPAADA